ncbi:ABC transporter substrate-binding protein [Motilimonas sp. E26]|uniref:ABC transporter substrate-binding protein n=1 Tax=Motilimonas sp. E26 TaxID=2865674 RepID=UPI001E5FDB05|nr:ABC transporter substrate-binding protein [Motilimonas sp. E26]MCE0557882.1 oligopeptide ABC transporter substrate-binding protein OppA [Motilimonas sp. E26]
MKRKQSLIAFSVITAFALSSQVLAADVPAGTELAAVQELVKGNGAEVATLDPHKAEGVPEANVLRDLFEGLVTSGPNGETLPAAAESWETADNKTYIFHMRQGAKWSNGDPVTAHDFEYAFKRAVNPATASPYSWYFEKATIKNAKAIIAGTQAAEQLGVKAKDDNTLIIELDKPLPYFVSMLYHTSTNPVHKASVEKLGDKWTRPGNMVSNGAYKLDTWTVNERIVLSRNEQYWDNANTVINKVSYLPLQSQNAEMNRFLADEIHMTYEMPIEHFKRLKKEYPESIRVTGYVGTYYYQFNTKQKPFDDVRVRTALSYTINREAIANFVLGQGQTPAYSFTPKIVDGFEPAPQEWAGLSQKERDAKAKALLAEAGYNKDNPLKFSLLYNTSENHKKVAIAVSSMWKKGLGVEAKLENQEWKTYLDSKKQGNFSVARAGWIADYNEASSMLSLLESDNGNNDGKYNSPAYDKLMANSRITTDPVERANYYQQAETILSKDMPVAPIYQYVTARLVKPYLGGYPNNPLDNLYSKDMYLIKQ